MIKRVLMSVSDKTGLVEFAKGLSEFNVEIISTGGTAKALREAGLNVNDVSKVTGFPEMMDGRVKTLHPAIHGALLALRKNSEHMNAIKQHNIVPIDMVVVNLYPFEKTVAKEDCSLENAIENIDIGGPSMIRSASKNFESVIVIVNPNKYKEVLDELKSNNGELGIERKRELAVEAFMHTAEYDTVISGYLYSKLLKNANKSSPFYKESKKELDKFPDKLLLRFNKVQSLRYGENPHQSASFYSSTNSEPCIANAKQLHGKELSYNNIMDSDAAIEIVREFNEPAAVIIKHTNPCGTAVASDIENAYTKAYETDSLSAFGGIVALNRKLTKKIAEQMKTIFLEVVIAPEFDKDALEILMQKKDIRLLELQGLGVNKSHADNLMVRKVIGGLLAQDRDIKEVKKEDLKVVTKKVPSEKEISDMLFAWKVVKHVKSNAIVIVKDGVTLGVGAGQMNRVGSVKIAVEYAKDRIKGSVLASDAMFPKPDGVEEASKAGVTAIIQTGGSINDKEVISAADKYNIAMVFTGIRHFKH